MTTTFPLFPSASQDPDVAFVVHRFIHMEREEIINMEQVSESGPKQPMMQPVVAPVITRCAFISASVPSVATPRPSVIDIGSGLNFSQPNQPSFGLGFPQPSSSQHGFGLGFPSPVEIKIVQVCNLA